jgi:hypothetical protein
LTQVLIQADVAVAGVAYGQYASIDSVSATHLSAANYVTIISTPSWSSATAYTTGQGVTGTDTNFYVALESSTDVQPVGDESGHWELIGATPATLPAAVDIGGVFISGSAVDGYVLTATGASTATWQAASGGGASATQVVSKTGVYTAHSGDIVLANATSGAFTVTLPAAVADEMVWVKKTDSSTNAITVAPASGTIDGASTASVANQYDALQFVSDGTNWFIF